MASVRFSRSLLSKKCYEDNFFQDRCGVDTLLITEKRNDDTKLKYLRLHRDRGSESICLVINNEVDSGFQSDNTKVEKTILLKNDNEYFLIFVEMKTTLSVKEYKACRKKFHDSIDHVLPYISLMESSCYNAVSEINLNIVFSIFYRNYHCTSTNNDPKRSAKRLRRAIESNKNHTYENINSCIFDKLYLPILLYSSDDSHEMDVFFKDIVGKFKDTKKSIPAG